MASLDTIVHFFGGFCCMETWGRHRKIPQQIALETTNQEIYSKIHCERHELLGSSKDSKCWVQNVYDEESFESITDSQLKHRP